MKPGLGAILVGLFLVPTAAARDDLGDQVDAAIADGLEYLRRQQSRQGYWDFQFNQNHRLGMTALAGLAMLENGVDLDDDAIRRAKAYITESAIDSEQTYDVSLSILFLARVQEGSDAARDDLIARLGRRLDTGRRDGQWSYRFPGVEDSSSRPGSGGDPWRAGVPDNSNTQFALLGAWGAGRHGFDSDPALAGLDDHFRGTANGDGGWSYHSGGGSSDAMTCAGLMALAIAAARPSEAERLSARARGAALAADPVFKSALAHVTRDARNIGPRSDVYYLWSLERVCVALGLRDLDGLDWYADGAEELLSRQLPTGSWPGGRWGALPETCLAMLFLRKANLAFELDRVLKLPNPDAPKVVQVSERTDAAAPPEPVAGDDGVRVAVRQVDESGFPRIALEFEAQRPDGTALLDGTKEDFRVFENEEPVEVVEFEAPTSKETRETTVVLVVDHSRSMREEDRIGALKDAVKTFLQVMPIGSRVAVVAFSDEIEVVCPFTTDVREVQRAVDALIADGGTRYYDAVVEALDLLSKESGRRAVLALTDGEDTFSQKADLESCILEARRSGLPVHTLGLGSEDEIASNDLRRLATETRGQYFPAQEADQLRAIYEEIAQRLGQMYRLVYRTNRELPDGTLRPVSVVYRAATATAGKAELFIRGMVVPASGWPRLFLLLVGGLAFLAIAPGLLRRRAGRSAP